MKRNNNISFDLILEEDLKNIIGGDGNPPPPPTENNGSGDSDDETYP